MSDQPTAQTPIFSWLVTSCFDAKVSLESGERSVFWKVGGVIRLQPIKIPEDIRYWTIDPIEEGKQTEVAKQISLEMAREAEANCEGNGGGKHRYALRAYMNGQRNVLATYTFGVELEPDGHVDPYADTSPKAIIAMLTEAHREKDRIISQMAKNAMDGNSANMSVIREQGKLIEVMPKMMLELFEAMKVVSQNQIGNEAQAFADAQRAKDISEFLDSLKPYIPMAITHLLEKNSAVAPNGPG